MYEFFPYPEDMTYPDASELGIVGAASVITGVMPIHHRNRPSDDPWAAALESEFEADGFIPRNATPPF